MGSARAVGMETAVSQTDSRQTYTDRVCSKKKTGSRLGVLF